jgi:S1-C subfamily serine protease
MARMRPAITAVLIAVVCGGVAGGVIARAADNDPSPSAGAGARALTPPATADAAPARGMSPAAIYRRDSPGVVVITATSTERVAATPFTPPATRNVQSLGSGFVIDRNGDILTNDHVVAGAQHIRVGFSGNTRYPAKVLGTDASTDLAVVRVTVPAWALHPLAFDDSANAPVGEPVYAIGNPFGLDRTMTAGIVSATGRDIEAPNHLTITDAIQTDAPINHGNSGGPLLDDRGRVLGVNSQIEGGTVDANVGVGFAVSSDTARSVAQQLIARGRVEHGWIGVEVQTVDPSVAHVVRGLPAHGVVVARVVAGSPAAKAGIRPASRQVTVDGVSAPLGGDVIVALDGKPLGTSSQLADGVTGRKPGDQVTLTVVRGSHRREVRLTLAAAPSRA